MLGQHPLRPHFRRDLLEQVGLVHPALGDLRGAQARGIHPKVEGCVIDPGAGGGGGRGNDLEGYKPK